MDRLPTKGNLFMRGLDTENSLCVMCGV